jgi:glycosyltransferase involved in cell wall biosynthesis
MNILTDFHHNSLLRSFVMLFEERLGMHVYRPIGLEWFYEGYWAINDQLDTAKQFLDVETQVLADNTPPLNVVKEHSDGVYSVYDPGNTTTHNGITLEAFKSRKFDFIIASIPAHIPLFQELINKFQPDAKLIIQIGNNWDPNIFRGLNVMGSVNPGSIEDANIIYYHQEFDTSIFKPRSHKISGRISSYVNLLQELPIGWRDFNELEKSIPEIKFNSYGGQCRDGNMSGALNLANSMNNDDLVFHVKDHGDGYGHIIYNAYACGRPTIIRSSMYKNQLAQELFNDGSCIDLDQYSNDDAIKKIKEICINRDILDEMSANAYQTFKHNVDFAYDAERIYNWMGTL